MFAKSAHFEKAIRNPILCFDTDNFHVFAERLHAGRVPDVEDDDGVPASAGVAQYPRADDAKLDVSHGNDGDELGRDDRGVPVPHSLRSAHFHRHRESLAKDVDLSLRFLQVAISPLHGAHVNSVGKLYDVAGFQPFSQVEPLRQSS